MFDLDANRPSEGASSQSFVQRTYDECYLLCSRAVYWEKQSNESEAQRYWKAALKGIQDFFANDPLLRTDEEKTFIDRLRELELRCKEQIELLETLKISRQASLIPGGSSSSSGNAMVSSRESSDQERREQGWIGDGTIPAITYSELSRPSPSPGLPPRPSLPVRTSSEQAVIGGSASKDSFDYDRGYQAPSARRLASQVFLTPSSQLRSAQSPSPERHAMRTTLRTTLRPNKSKDKQSKSSSGKQAITAPDKPGASKAATLAWSSMFGRDKSSKAAINPGILTAPAAPAAPFIDGANERLARTASQASMHWDSHTRRLVAGRAPYLDERTHSEIASRNSDDYFFGQPSSLSVSAASSAINNLTPRASSDRSRIDGENITRNKTAPPPSSVGPSLPPVSTPDLPSSHRYVSSDSYERRTSTSSLPFRRRPQDQYAPSTPKESTLRRNLVAETVKANTGVKKTPRPRISSSSSAEDVTPRRPKEASRKYSSKKQDRQSGTTQEEGTSDPEAAFENETEETKLKNAWKERKAKIMKNLPPGVEKDAAKQILNEIVVQGDEVHWTDVAGLEVAKKSLKETVVYPFLRPDLFMGLREPARGMLLFGPPGTGKTMLARAVATESKSTFFSISASSLTSKYLGESEKLVRALFGLAKVLAPSIIFVDEIDSLLSHRSGSGEHEATRRIKTEFLICWSDLQRAAAGRENSEKDKAQGDANMVLVLAATNLPWAIDEAARRRFVRRQYIPLPEPETREVQLKTLLGQQKHTLTQKEIKELVGLTDGFSGSDITALAKDAAMGPLRSLGEALLHMTMDEIRPIGLEDFKASLTTIRPSVGKEGLEKYETWAREFGERGG